MQRPPKIGRLSPAWLHAPKTPTSHLPCQAVAWWVAAATLARLPSPPGATPLLGHARALASTAHHATLAAWADSLGGVFAMRIAWKHASHPHVGGEEGSGEVFSAAKGPGRVRVGNGSVWSGRRGGNRPAYAPSTPSSPQAIVVTDSALATEVLDAKKDVVDKGPIYAIFNQAC